MTFTLPSGRSVGSPDPPGDVNNLSAALAAHGAGLNVLSAAWAGGADPTGTADSTAAIQAALDAADGKTVYIPPGTYKITSTLHPPVAAGISGACIAGAGWASVLRFDQAVCSPAIGLAGTTQAKCDIRDLMIQQGGAADGGTAIDISYMINSVISNVYIAGATHHCTTGISGAQNGTFYNVISDCRISVAGTAAKGITLSNNANSNVIRNCRILAGADAASAAVYLNAHSTTVDHVDVESGGGTGIFVDASAGGTTIINPYLEANKYGIQLAAGVVAPVILGGTIQSSTTANILDSGAVGAAIIAAWPNSGNTVLGNFVLPGNPGAADQNLIAWAYDPAAGAGANTAPATGQVQLVRMTVRQACTVTNILLHVIAAGNTLTTGQNWAGLYTATGTLLSATGDQTTAWGTTGLKTMALTAAQPVQAGTYYAGFVANGTGSPAFLRGAGLTGEANLINAGLTSGTARFATNGTLATTLADVTMSANTLAAVGFWAALS